MRLVATEYLTLDGVFAEPGHWSFPYFNEQAAKFKSDELEATEALLLGRKTYEGFAAAWPTMEGTGEFGVRMNTMPKYVVSSTLESPEWNNSTVLKGDAVNEVSKLKQELDGRIVVPGSIQLVRALLGHDLVDELRLLVFPIVLGAGERLFGETSDKKPMRLVETQSGDDVAFLAYEPVRDS